MNRRILVFPGGMPRSLAYCQRASADGLEVIGASSMLHDPARAHYSEWTYLPYVTSIEFDDALQRAIEKFGITGIFTPNPVVWDYLQRNMEAFPPGVGLVSGSPIESEMAPYRAAMQFGASVFSDPLPLSATFDRRASISALEIAALFRHAECIPGMCDHDKIRALCEIFRVCPAGDIVEIGSWWGKSAFVLFRLAQCYGTGKLLCIDPWSKEHLIQNDDRGIVDRVSVDVEEALNVFLLNLLPYANGSLNYLRLPSVEAAKRYRRNTMVETATFGRTTYSGQIAILHIDGNHSYANARSDVDSWSSAVVPAGWIVIDDYLWPFGDGPRRVGDELLLARGQRIACSFVMGSALFVQLAESL